MKRIKIILLILLVPLVLGGRETVEQKKGKCCPLFMSEEILDLDLEYDVNKLRKDRGPSRVYHPAKLSYTGPDGKRVTLDVQLKVRGKLRRTLLKCTVPPFKIKFDETQTPNTLFEDQTSLKIVSHCKNKPKFYQEYTLQEYLLYKIYNLLTDLSFRVRMARITYNDSAGKESPNTKYAFFIERYKHMARRNNAETVNITSIAPEKADFATATLVSVFEYMIGNTDWSIRSSHNMKLVTLGDNPIYFPVPFDFDQAGMIDAHYARPDELLPIRSVRERLYRGFCKDKDQFNRTFAIFHKHKEEIMALFRNSTILPEKIKKKNLKYLEGFYKIITKPKLVKRYFIDNYRGRPFPKR
jgi:hypothetical protein